MIKSLVVVSIFAFVLAVEAGLPAGQYVISVTSSGVCSVLTMASGGECGSKVKERKTVVLMPRATNTSLAVFESAKPVSTRSKIPYTSSIASLPNYSKRKVAKLKIPKARGKSTSLGAAAAGSMLVEDESSGMVSMTGERPPWQDQDDSDESKKKDGAQAGSASQDFGGFRL